MISFSSKFMIGGALCAVIALTGTVVFASTTTTLTTEQITCMKSAIDKRETALGNMLDTYMSVAKASLSARGQSLSTAWSIEDAASRKTAIKAAWETYKTTLNVARKTKAAAKRASWNIFYSEQKICGQVITSADKNGSSADNQL